MPRRIRADVSRSPSAGTGGVSSSQRSLQAGAPASELQPSGWTGPPSASDRPRSSRCTRQPEAWNGSSLVARPRSSTTRRVRGPSSTSQTSICPSSSVPGCVVSSRWWGASHTSMRAGPVQVLVKTTWTVPPTRRSPSTWAIQRASLSGVVQACHRSPMSVSKRSSIRMAPRFWSSVRIRAIGVTVEPSFLVRSRCGGRRAGSARAGGTPSAIRRPRSGRHRDPHRRIRRRVMDRTLTARWLNTCDRATG